MENENCKMESARGLANPRTLRKCLNAFVCAAASWSGGGAAPFSVIPDSGLMVVQL